MCGIAGLLSTGEPVTHDVIARMVARMAQRGPDGEGIAIESEGLLGLGHRRLAILDLSPAGHQPMESSCRRFVISFNGEIYNFAQLRADLDAEGGAPRWRGHSDTEILLAAFARWGIESTLHKADGMFAIALWDRETRCLTLARDRFGEKPLYYGFCQAGFAFASTLAPIRTLPGFEEKIEPQAQAALMARAYIPAPWSILEGIFKLEPGCLLTLSSDQARQRVLPRPERWFDHGALVLAAAADSIEDPAEAIHMLKDALERSVQRQIVADVPVGTFLSGGIDSSLITALAQRSSAAPVRSFTIGFTEADYDEAVFARKVAAHLGTDHTELIVTPRDALDVIPGLPTSYDEPFADSSQIPTSLLAALARGTVTVALSGDGGDELFGGYTRHQQIPRLWRRIAGLPPEVRRRGLGLAARLPHGLWDAAARMRGGYASPQFGRNAQRAIGIMAHARDIDDLFDRFLDDWTLHPSPLRQTASRQARLSLDPRLAALPLEAAMMHADATTYLPGDILTKVDRAAMAVSLETRVPMLGTEVIHTAARISPALNLGGGGKRVLKELLYTLVPRPLVERRKAGFAVPLGDWLRGPLRDWAESLLTPADLDAAGYVPEVVRARWAAHLARHEEATQPLWSILMMQAWLHERTTG